MENIKSTLRPALGMLLAFTVLCGMLYTLLVTGLLQAAFSWQANGSLLLDREGRPAGSLYLAQPDRASGHLWGRPQPAAVEKLQSGESAFYGAPSNLSPASAELGQQLLQRITALRAADPEQSAASIPVDLVTASGSGLDPEISLAAARWQLPRLERETGRSRQELQAVLEQASEGRFLGIFGEPRVNVLKANLLLDGRLQN